MNWSHRLGGGSRRRLVASAATAVLLMAGLGAVGAGFAAQHHAPQPPASAGLPATRVATPSRTTVPVSSNPAAPLAPVLAASVPTFLDIPAIGVHHSLTQLGQDPDGTLQVPPLSDVAVPGWDRYSPAPGQLGPAVILGHIDAATQGRGVFYSLGALKPGDTVSVTRADHTVAVFRVDGVNEYAKGNFPTLTVYGNTPNAQLRLITCGGPFDATAHSYIDNIVTFATLISSHTSA